MSSLPGLPFCITHEIWQPIVYLLPNRTGIFCTDVPSSREGLILTPGTQVLTKSPMWFSGVFILKLNVKLCILIYLCVKTLAWRSEYFSSSAPKLLCLGLVLLGTKLGTWLETCILWREQKWTARLSWEFSCECREGLRVNHVGHCPLDVFSSPTSQ